MDKLLKPRLKIVGTGSYLPERILSNLDLEKLVETNDQWIRERTGICQRHIAGQNQETSDLALIAAQRALEQAQLPASAIDMIVFATVTPDKIMPNTACILQKKLGCRNVMSFDISAACTGFVYALSMANQYIQTGACRTVLVVGAEVLHRYVDYSDRETCILFGDGAGAAVVTACPEKESSQILSEHLYADGSIHDLFELPTVTAADPFQRGPNMVKTPTMRMKGREVFKHAVRTMTACCEQALQQNGLGKDDIDWLIPHQANERILDSVARHFEIPNEKVVINLDKTGNTSAATIPIALDEAVRDGRIKRDQLILLAAFGAGVTNGSILLRF